MSIGTTSTKNRVAVVLAGLAFVFVLAVLWLKTGRLPAAAGGDEVWMGEGAYWILQTGVQRFDFLADEHGHQVVSTFQPISSFFSALAFALLGITPFSLMAQIPVVGTAVMALLVAICRRLGSPWALSILLPVSAWGLMMVERRLNTVRWEPMLAMWLLVAFLLLLAAKQSSSGLANLLRFAAGVSTTLAGVTYYPHAPFAVLAGTGAAFILANFRTLRGFIQGVWAFVLGGLVSGGIFLSWIGAHYEYFDKQVLAFGNEHYFRIGNLLWPLKALVPGAGTAMTDYVALWEHWFVLVVVLSAVFFLRDARWRAAAFMAVVMCGPVFLYRKPTADAAGGLFGALLLAGLAVYAPRLSLRRGASGILLALALLAVGRFGLMAYTTWAQADRRSYAIFEEKLMGALGPDHGKIATAQFAWIALREKKGAGEFNFIAKYGDPSYDYRSTALRTREGVESHTHIIVAEGYDGLIRTHYPDMAAAIEDGTFVKVTDIEMPGPKLPWAGAPVYECTVYRNTRLGPNGAGGGSGGAAD